MKAIYLKKRELGAKLKEMDRGDLFGKIQGDSRLLDDEITIDEVIQDFLKLFPDKKVLEIDIVPDVDF